MKTNSIITALLATTLASSAQLVLADDLRGGGPRGPGEGGFGHNHSPSRYSYEIELIQSAIHSARYYTGPRTFERAEINLQELSRRAQILRSDRQRLQLLSLISDTQDAICDRRASYEYKIARLQMNGESMIRILQRLDDDCDSEQQDRQTSRSAAESHRSLSDAVRAATYGDLNGTLNAILRTQQSLSMIRTRDEFIRSAKDKVGDVQQRLNRLTFIPTPRDPRGGGATDLVLRIALQSAIQPMQQAQQDIVRSGLMGRGEDRRDEHGHGHYHGYGPRPR